MTRCWRKSLDVLLDPHRARGDRCVRQLGEQLEEEGWLWPLKPRRPA
jgi:hypothetical protein